MKIVLFIVVLLLAMQPVARPIVTSPTFGAVGLIASAATFIFIVALAPHKADQ